MRLFALGVALAFFFLPFSGALSQETPSGRGGAASAPEAQEKEGEPSAGEQVPAPGVLNQEALNKKLALLAVLLTDVNTRITSGDLSARTLQNKRRYENRLRDLIIHFALTDQALNQVDRLKEELDYLDEPDQKEEPRLRALRNFVKARLDDYAGFVTR